ITKELSKLEGISQVKVNEETSIVELEAENSENFESVKNKLAVIGYPVVGDDNSTLQKAKSYVSCMIGRVS
ncbi:MAG: heavy metal transporter, partial [Bacteroidia bacterium]